MVINIAVALLAHQVLQLVREIIFFTEIIFGARIDYKHETVLVSLYYTLFSYFGTVLMLLFAAEAVNLFVRIVLVFSEIKHYVIKATLIAWSEQQLYIIMFFSL